VVVFGKDNNALIQCKYTSSQKYDSVEPLIQIHGAKPTYEGKTGKIFSQLIVAVNARKYTRKVISAAQTYKIELVTQKDLDKLLQKYDVSRKQIQRRLLGSRIFEN
jgi:hypothetical protein